jgi:ABC-type lipoprotein release transport system permease subunit
VSTTAPFAPFEWMIAWRYLRARRAEGGVSVMTWISFVGIALAVFALVATLAIRAGLRSDFLDQMLGANAHVELRFVGDVSGSTLIDGYADLADRVAALPGVVDAAPLVRAQVLGSFQGRNAPVDVYGIRAEDLWQIPMIDAARQAGAAVDRFDDGIALGAARCGCRGQRDVRHPVDPVLIAAMNIVSGLIMLVKNKGRDIGILRTMGLSEGSVLRVFFICGALVGHRGHALSG